MQETYYSLRNCGTPDGARFRLGEILVSGRVRWELAAVEVAVALTLHSKAEPGDGPVVSRHHVRRLLVRVVTTAERDRTTVSIVPKED